MTTIDRGVTFLDDAAARQTGLHSRRATIVPGESGELGENPHKHSLPAGRMAGEKGRILGESAPDAHTAYPTAALGPLAGAALAIAEGGQLDVAMAGQTVLATAALLTQGLFNVRTLAGCKPLSLFFCTIADSGDGKSTAEGVALARVHTLERLGHVAHGDALARRGADDPAPRTPYRLVKNATAQGIWRGFKDGQPSQGSFTAEGAAMLCGWGMSKEHSSHTCAALNDLWDGSAISLARGAEGQTQLYGKRLSAHWLIQPEPARDALHDPLLEAIGFWPRFLLAWPQPLAPRLAREWRPERSPAISAFWTRCEELYQRPLPDGCDDLPAIEASPEALALACATFERLEREARTAGGKLVDVKPYAVRATEQAFRIAAVLAAFDGREVIDVDAMRGGIALVAYSLETWKGVFGCREDSERYGWARALHAWMGKQPDGRASETAMLKNATPKRLRVSHRRDTALALLEGAGLIRRAMDYTLSGGERLVYGTWEVVNHA